MEERKLQVPVCQEGEGSSGHICSHSKHRGTSQTTAAGRHWCPPTLAGLRLHCGAQAMRGSAEPSLRQGWLPVQPPPRSRTDISKAAEEPHGTPGLLSLNSKSLCVVAHQESARKRLPFREAGEIGTTGTESFRPTAAFTLLIDYLLMIFPVLGRTCG